MNTRSTIIALVCLAQAGWSQWRADMYLNQAYDSNPFRLPEPKASWVTTADLGMQYDFGGVAVSYQSNYPHFGSFPDHNHYWHQASLFGESGATNLGIYYTQRYNQDDFTLYNYYTAAAYINHSFDLSGINIYALGNGILTGYGELSDLDNIELNGIIRLNKGFETRTTLITGFGLYYKDYTQSYMTTDSSVTGGGGQMGGGMGPGSGSGPVDYYTVELDAPSVSQWQAWFRVAQSVLERTGLSAQVMIRRSITGSARFVSGPTLGYNEESEIFDDPMGYALQSVGSELSSILPGQVFLKISYYQGYKNYITQGIYLSESIYDPDILRNDRYTSVTLNARKSIPAGNMYYEIRFFYQWYRNTSNSYWYTYDNHYSSISFGISF